MIPDDFPWSDSEWPGLPLSEYILYELHTGTFSEPGTFDGIVDNLDRLVDLGITALELMPIAQFPGDRNWGYDGVYPFAVQHSYGGIGGLKKLVNECHRRGVAVVVDAVYNHLGPEGNYFSAFGPYFIDTYKTPWGAAVNFDGPYSDEVRSYFLHNALFWIEECHVDALRLDAIDRIYDSSPYPFLEELSELVDRTAERLDRHIYLISETDANDPRVLRPRNKGGLGMNAQWDDDFHHALHTCLTGERHGYYQDYGKVDHLGEAFRKGFVYTGQYSSFRKKRRGRKLDVVDPRRLVVFLQNHDQVGNRAQGDRLTTQLSREALKAGAATVLLSPFTPLLFMGEEYAETAPFPFFINHSEEELIEAVRKGRLQEFAHFHESHRPPDAQAVSTFESARLGKTRDQEMFRFYKALIALRKQIQWPSGSDYAKVSVEQQSLVLLVSNHTPQYDLLLLIINLSSDPVLIETFLEKGQWEKLFDSSEEEWSGPGSSLPRELAGTGGNLRLELQPKMVALYRRR